MARILIFVAVALFASAVVGLHVYNDDDLEIVNDVVAKCVKHVKPKSDFDRPGDECRFEGIDAFVNGIAKEDVPLIVVSCLLKKGVDEATIDECHACMAKDLA